MSSYLQKSNPVSSAATEATLTSNLCEHCSQPLKKNQSRFCCHGCETVFQLLHDVGLDEFYQIRKDGFCFQPIPSLKHNSTSSYDHWDSETNPKSQKSEIKLFIDGIHCSACLWLLEKLPQLLPDMIENCRLNLQSSIMVLKLHPQAKLSSIALQIVRLGYTPHLVTHASDSQSLRNRSNRKFLMDVGVSGALAGNIMLMSIPLYAGVEGSFRSYFEWITFALATPALFYSGRRFFSQVWKSIRLREFSIDVPILVAILVAYGYSSASLIQETHDLYFDSISMLIFLLLSSRYYLARLRQSSALSLGTLDLFQAASQKSPGEVISITPGTQLDFDGIIVQGSVWVDASRFSGESELVCLKPGDSCFAGTIVQEITPEHLIRVTAHQDDTRIAKILNQVRETQGQRTRIEQKHDQYAKHLLQAVGALSLLTFTFFAAQGALETAITRTLTLLIITCPCAFALGTPLSLSLGLKKLLKQNILVKDPNVLETCLQTHQIYFDKTGTLTEGNLRVTQSVSSFEESHLHRLASLATLSSHPVSKAIYRWCMESQDSQFRPIIQIWDHINEVPGRGIYAYTREGRGFALIRPESHHSTMTEVALVTLPDENEVLRLTLSDTIREDSASVIQSLHQNGYTVGILSGDHSAAANRIAKALNIETVHAELTPEQKSSYAEGHIMVGDGVNDALALSKAKVGIAVQGGIESAIESAAVYSLKPGTQSVSILLDTARQVQSVLKRNFVLSTSYNIIGAALSITGVLTPLIAAILMPLSAFTVFTYTLSSFRASTRETSWK